MVQGGQSHLKTRAGLAGIDCDGCVGRIWHQGGEMEITKRYKKPANH